MHSPRTTLILVIAGVLAATGCSLFGSSSDSHHAAASSHATGTKPRTSRIELNSASRSDLAGLPGLSDADADHIIAGRPYKKKTALLNKKILDQKKFDGIKDTIYVDHETK